MTKHPTHVTVFRVLITHGKRKQPIFFKHREVLILAEVRDLPKVEGEIPGQVLVGDVGGIATGLNPLEYFWWSVIEVNSTSHPNLDFLRVRIADQWHEERIHGTEKWDADKTILMPPGSCI